MARRGLFRRIDQFHSASTLSSRTPPTHVDLSSIVCPPFDPAFLPLPPLFTLRAIRSRATARSDAGFPGKIEVQPAETRWFPLGWPAEASEAPPGQGPVTRSDREATGGLGGPGGLEKILGGCLRAPPPRGAVLDQYP